MPLNVLKGTITSPAAVGNQTYSLPANFDPKAILLWTTGQTADGVTNASALFSIGAATYDGAAAQQWYNTVWSMDNSATSQTCRGTGVTACLKGYSGYVTTTVTVDFIVAFVNFVTGASSSFTLNWSDLPATPGVLVHYMVLGGADITKARCGSTTITTAATLAVTVATGWGQPALLLFSSTRAGSNADVTSEIGQGIGWAKSDIERYCSATYVANSAATVTCGSFQAARATAVLTTTPGIDGYSDLGARTAWPVDGFQFNNVDVYGGSRLCLWLALQGTFLSSIQNGSAPTTAAPATQAFSLPSGTVKGAFLWGNSIPANAAVDVAHADLFGRFVGGTDGTNHGTCGHTEDDNNATSVTSNFFSRTKAVQHYVADAAGGPSTLASEADASLSGPTLTLNWNDTDTVARDFGVVLLGDTTSAGPPTFTGASAVSLDSPVTAGAGTFLSTASSGSAGNVLAELACAAAGTFALSATQAAKTFPFAADAEGWVGTPATNSTATYDGTTGNPPGSLKVRISGRNKGPEVSYWEWSGTWEALGVPAGHVATGLSASLDYSCTEYATGAASTAGPLELYDNAGGLLATLIAAGPFSATTGWTSLPGGAVSVPAAAQASGTIIRLRASTTLATGGSNTAAISVQFDNVALVINHASPSFTGTSGTTLDEPASAAAGVQVVPTFTGSTANTLGVLATSAAGTFFIPPSTGTSSAVLVSITVATAGTFAAPVYSAVAGNVLSVLGSAATGTSSGPVATGLSAAALSAASSAAAGMFAAPVYSGASAPTLLVFATAAPGTHAAPTYTAAAAASLAVLAVGAAGTSTVPVYGGTSAPTLLVATATSAGTFAAPVYAGTAPDAVGPVTSAAAGAFAVAVFSGTSAALLPASAPGAAGAFAAPVYSGASAAAATSAAAAAAGTHARPVYTGAGAAALSAPTSSGTGLFAAVVYSGSAADSLPALSATAAGACAPPAYTGAGAPSLPEIVCAAAGTRTSPVYTAAATTVLRAPSSAGTGAFAMPVFAGEAAASLEELTVFAPGMVAAPVYAGGAATPLPNLAVTAPAVFTPPGIFTGALGISLPALECVSTAAFATRHLGRAADGLGAVLSSGMGAAIIPPPKRAVRVYWDSSATSARRWQSRAVVAGRWAPAAANRRRWQSRAVVAVAWKSYARLAAGWKI